MGLICDNPRSAPVEKPLLGKNTDGKDTEGDSFHLRSVTCLLKLLSDCTRPDMPMEAHKVANVCTNPKACHNVVVKGIGKHFLGTSDEGLI